MAYSTLVEDAGAMADRGEVRERLDGLLKGASSSPKGSPRRPTAMTPEEAARIASEVEGHDSKMAKGR